MTRPTTHTPHPLAANTGEARQDPHEGQPPPDPAALDPQPTGPGRPAGSSSPRRRQPSSGPAGDELARPQTATNTPADSHHVFGSLQTNSSAATPPSHSPGSRHHQQTDPVKPLTTKAARRAAKAAWRFTSHATRARAGKRRRHRPFTSRQPGLRPNDGPSPLPLARSLTAG